MAFSRNGDTPLPEASHLPEATAEGKAAVVAAMATCGHLATACATAEVKYATARYWRANDPAFREALEDAKIEFTTIPYKTWKKAAETEWAAAARLLEKLDRENFGTQSQQPSTITIQIDVAEPIRIIPPTMTEVELRALTDPNVLDAEYQDVEDVEDA